MQRPDVTDAFFAGYGRRLTDVEEATLMATSAAGHITQMAWATEHGDSEFAAAGRANPRRMIDAPLAWPRSDDERGGKHLDAGDG